MLAWRLLAYHKSIRSNLAATRWDFPLSLFTVITSCPGSHCNKAGAGKSHCSTDFIKSPWITSCSCKNRSHLSWAKCSQEELCAAHGAPQWAPRWRGGLRGLRTTHLWLRAFPEAPWRLPHRGTAATLSARSVNILTSPWSLPLVTYTRLPNFMP